MAYLTKNQRARQSWEGTHRREAFDRLTEGGWDAVGSHLAIEPIIYGQSADAKPAANILPDDAKITYERRYSTGRFADPIRLIAKSWERSLVPPEPLLNLPTQRDPGTPAASVGTTAFDPDWRWQHLYVDLPPFRFFAEKYCPSSVADIGCGVGAYLALFKKLGSTAVFGVDGMPFQALRGMLADGEYRAHDLSKQLTAPHTFDLVLCLEVVEHLPEQDALALINTIDSFARSRIVFSGAEPHQPGHGHINCQPLEYWLDQWRQRKWFPNVGDTLSARALASTSWFRRNLVVLEKCEPAAEAEARVAALLDIASKSYAWYAQVPSIFTEAFQDSARFFKGQAYAV